MDQSTTGGDEREVRPCGRYDWESILRRARLGGLIPAMVGSEGQQTRGAVSGMAFQAVALTFATYADDKGNRVFPGDATVATDLETTIKVVKRVRDKLVELGLLQKVGNRHGEYGQEYRLTLPSDLFDRVEVLTPAQHKLAAQRLRDKARGKPGGPTGPPETGDADRSGGPGDPHTDKDRNTGTTDNSGDHLRTDVTAVDDPPPEQDPIFRGGGCPHGLSDGYRVDGVLACVFCRREAARGDPTLAPVIPLHPPSESVQEAR